MNIEIINTGSELMLGFVLNTHQQWLCRELSDRGWVVNRQTAVHDTAEDIRDGVREALSRADLVITTGGLGPTSDDMTRTVIAQMLGRTLHDDPQVLAVIRGYFERRKRPLPPGTEIQAQIPAGAIVLPNANGTAPGLAMEIHPNPFRARGAKSWLIMLPGPPRELRPMFHESLVPLLLQQFGRQDFACRVYRTTGLGESALEAIIAPPLAGLVAEGLGIGYCARVGEVDVRLTAPGSQGETLLDRGGEILNSLVGRNIFSRDGQSLEEVIVKELADRKTTLCLAESCTGGYIANRLTNVPGASESLIASLVTYHNRAKQVFLGVRPETLEAHGAVSEQTAREMAEGARQRCATVLALAVTGIAGPGGGTSEKPVGTVYLALAHQGRETAVLRQFNPYDRETFKYVTSQQGLELVRRRLLEV